MSEILNDLKDALLNKNIWAIISFLITLFIPYWWGKRKEKIKKINEELPEILETYMKPIYNDLLKINMNNNEEIKNFVSKYVNTGTLHKLSNPNLVHNFYRVDVLLRHITINDFSEKDKAEIKKLISNIEDYYWFLIEEVYSDAYKVFTKYEKNTIENTKNLVIRNIKVILDYVNTLNIFLILVYLYYLALVSFKIVGRIPNNSYKFLGIWMLVSYLLIIIVNNIFITNYKSKLKNKRSISTAIRIADEINKLSKRYEVLQSVLENNEFLNEEYRKQLDGSDLLNEKIKTILASGVDSKELLDELRDILREKNELDKSLKGMKKKIDKNISASKKVLKVFKSHSRKIRKM